MTRLSKLICAGLILGLGSFLLSAPAAYAAPTNSNTATVTLVATLGETLTVTAAPTSGSNVTFALVSGGTVTGSAPIAITTSWVLSSARTSVTVTGYFSTATAALTGTGSSPALIPTSEVLGSVNSGSFNAFTTSPGTGALGTAGASLVLDTKAISSTNRAGTLSDSLNLEINLTAQPQLPADTYTGTLNLQAQAL